MGFTVLYNSVWGPFLHLQPPGPFPPQNVNHVFTVCGKDCNGLRLQIDHSGVSHDCHLHMLDLLDQHKLFMTVLVIDILPYWLCLLST